MSWNSLIFYHWYLIPYSVSVIPFLDSGLCAAAEFLACHSVERPWERGMNWKSAKSQPRNVISAFRERGRRTIAIFSGSLSNAFFLRTAALGKRCILRMEYFIESGWLWHLIRSICWGKRKLTPCAHSCLQLLLKRIPLLLTLEYKYALCYSSSRFKAQMKWPNILKVAFIRLTLSGIGIHRITVQMTCYFNCGRSGSISETLRSTISLYGYG